MCEKDVNVDKCVIRDESEILCECCYTPLTDIEIEYSTYGVYMCFNCKDRESESYVETHEFQSNDLNDIIFS